MQYSYQKETFQSNEVYNNSLNSYMRGIYNYMAFALMLTGSVAIAAAYSQFVTSLMYIVQDDRIIGLSFLGWLISIVPIGIALAFSFGLPRMSIATTEFLFWSYAILLGLSLSSIFIIYPIENITGVFFIATVMFFGTSLYGYITKKDLSSWGSFLFMGLIGMLAILIVNFILRNSVLDMAISIMSILLFIGITAFDTQRIKNIHDKYYIKDKDTSIKISVLAALMLYLDFINIFMHLLHLFGKKRDNRF